MADFELLLQPLDLDALLRLVALPRVAALLAVHFAVLPERAIAGPVVEPSLLAVEQFLVDAVLVELRHVVAQLRLAALLQVEASLVLYRAVCVGAVQVAAVLAVAAVPLVEALAGAMAGAVTHVESQPDEPEPVAADFVEDARRCVAASLWESPV